MSIIHTTKCWAGDWQDVLAKIDTFLPSPKWVIANNLVNRKEVAEAFKGKVDKFIVAEDYEKNALKFFKVVLDKERPYTVSELVGLYLAKRFDYLMHYAGDVEITDHSWINELLLTDEIVAVSPGWGGDENHPSQDFDTWVRQEQKIYPDLIRAYDWGCLTPFFSDQAYLIKVDTFRKPIYNFSNAFIAEKYPNYGGNSFERRVGQWMMETGKRRAILKDWKYGHTAKPH